MLPWTELAGKQLVQSNECNKIRSYKSGLCSDMTLWIRDMLRNGYGQCVLMLLCVLLCATNYAVGATRCY